MKHTQDVFLHSEKVNVVGNIHAAYKWLSEQVSKVLALPSILFCESREDALRWELDRFHNGNAIGLTEGRTLETLVEDALENGDWSDLISESERNISAQYHSKWSEMRGTDPTEDSAWK